MSNNCIEMNEEESDGSDRAGASYVGLQGWTKEEKYRLLEGIRSFGSINIEAIQEQIKTKAHDEVMEAIDYFKEQTAIQAPARMAKRTASTQPQPLSNWAKILSDHLDFADCQTEISTALRLIADYDDIPKSLLTSNINFKDVYLYLANATEGKPIPSEKPEVQTIRHSIVETALLSKHFRTATEVKLIIDNLMGDQEVQYFAPPTPSYDVACLRHLISQKAYNPFNMPDSSLRLQD